MANLMRFKPPWYRDSRTVKAWIHSKNRAGRSLPEGTQLIQELVSEGVHAIQKYEPTTDKITRMSSVTNTIENGLAHLPDKKAWLSEYLHG
jgi:predicted phage terminase large subunit-like protein